MYTNPIVYNSKIRIAKHITKKKKKKSNLLLFKIKKKYIYQILKHFQKVNMNENLDRKETSNQVRNHYQSK